MRMLDAILTETAEIFELNGNTTGCANIGMTKTMLVAGDESR
jgi:hypothetical protein